MLSRLALSTALLALVAAPMVARVPADAPAAVQLVGRVSDAATGRAIADVQVSLPGPPARGAITRGDGRYTITFDDAWAARTVRVTFARIGYASATYEVVLAAGENTLDVQLSVAAIGLNEIVVTGTAGAARRREFAAAPAMRALPGRFDPDFNTESYARIDENRFVAVRAQPLSTFSIDVDRASYANVRRFIREGRRPPVDAVRIEELVNYFGYGDPPPEGDVPFTVTTEVSAAPWQPLHRLVRIALRSTPVATEDLPPNNLVFLLDVSGSMWSPDKLPLVKTALGMLVEQLRPQDRVALVVYAGAAGLVLPSTPGTEKAAILEAIEQLEAGGSTAGGAGIRLAYQVAADNHLPEGNNRVILATDGDFNVGASSDAEMVRLIEEKRTQGTYLTVLGFGTGNLQDSKMEQIANHGNGNFAYIDSPLEARKALVTEIGATLLTVAQDVKIQVGFNPARVAAYRLIGYENRLLANEDFADDTRDAGEMGAGHSVVALYEVIPVGVESSTAVQDVDPLRYQVTEVRPNPAATDELLFVNLRYKEPGEAESQLLSQPVRDLTGEASSDFRFAAAVAAWGMLLRDSPFVGAFGLPDVLQLGRGALGEDRERHRAEFLELVERTHTLELLAATSPPEPR